jgi:hypothetical protein
MSGSGPRTTWEELASLGWSRQGAYNALNMFPGNLSESRRITSFKCRISRHHNTDHYGKITPKAVYYINPHQSAVFCSNPAALTAMNGLPDVLNIPDGPEKLSLRENLQRAEAK